MKIVSTRYTTISAITFVASLMALAVSLTMLNGPSEPDHSAFSTPSGRVPSDNSGSPDSLYNALIGAADKYYNDKDYEKCMGELLKAQQIKPQDPVVKSRISNLKGLVDGQKDQKEAARKSIASGDAYTRAKDYLNAKSAYQLAVSQDPTDETAKAKLRQTIDLLRSQKATNILYDVAVASADKLFQAGEYDKAVQEYQNASKIMPGEAYPKNKVNEIIKIQVDTKVKGEEYSAAILRADKFYGAKNYADALLDYKRASGIKPEEKYPQDKIKEVSELLALQKAKDDAYNKAIARADQSFQSIQYADARKGYSDALGIKPEQAYPKERIREIDNILARNATAQANYDKFVTIADSFYIDKKYLKARENYVLASSAKPSEAYPKEMISKSEKMMTGQEAAMAKALEEQYAKAIADADKLFAEKSYNPAMDGYSKALGLKPGEQYPKDKIAEIETLVAGEMKDKDSRYTAAIASGDRAMSNKLYESARNDYQHALDIKPAEAYPKTKIAEADRLIAAEAKQKAADSRYANAIGKADSLMMIKDYMASKTEFQNASTMKPDEVYPKNRIVEINLILYNLEKQKNLELLYTNSITKGDKLFSEKNYAQARAEYDKALTAKPGESYPKDRLMEIDKIEADQAARKSLDNVYAGIIAGADKQYASKEYEAARVVYKQASDLKPEETYPKERIVAIDKALADLAALKSLDENYQATLAKADKLLTEKSYDQARNEFSTALGLKPEQQYPKAKIAAIDAILAGIAKQKALDDDYTAAIGRGDKLLGEKSYSPALAEYQAALTIKPAEEYPKGKIGEINQVLAGIEKQKSLDAQYTGAIARADKLFADKSFAPARAEYLGASTLRPEESYPKDQVAAIDKVLLDIAAAKALDDNYAAIVAGADKLLTAKSYEQARTEYQKAAGVKPAEVYPGQKIAEIDKILADIAAAKSLEENYKATIAAADRHLAEKSYDAARAEYLKASELQPQQAYPKGKITEIDKILADLAAAKVLEENYKSTLANADQLFTAKTWDAARAGYVKASGMQPQQIYPKDKITEIDKILADLAAAKALDEKYQAAVAKGDQLLTAKSYDAARAEYVKADGLQPAQSYPKQKIAEIDAALKALADAKALDAQYAGIIAKADQLLASKSYDDARAEFVKASGLKQGETYPKEKITEIDKILADIAAAKSLEEQYNAAITKADKLLTDKTYDGARAEYVRASELQPSQAYPKGKIAEIDKVLADIAAAKALEENYRATLAKADQFFTAKTYDAARAEYVRAADLQPQQTYPKEKITAIDIILADLAAAKALEEKYQSAIAKGDQLLAEKSYDASRAEFAKATELQPAQSYPKQKITEIDAALKALADAKARDERYAGIIAKADQLLVSKTYDAARTEYVSASGLKPGETYPKEKVAEIDKALADIAAAKALDEQYKVSIGKADKLLLAKTYEEARAEYTKAANLQPGQVYPATKIAEIDAALAAIARQKALDEEYTTAITSADKLLSEKSYEPAKAEYQKAATLKPAEQYPKTRLAEIDKALTDAARLKAIDDQYAAAIAGADKLLQDKSYEQAKTAYTDAGKIKPSEQYPKDKINEITAILASIAKQKALDDQYKTSIARADQLLAAKTYDQARLEYTNAQGLKPEEQYPKEKIAEIDGVLAEIKAREDAYKAVLASGDQFLAAKKYEDARKEYENAISMKPSATYPKEKIAEINKALEEMLGKQKYYDKLVAEADDYLKEKDYTKSKEGYQQALNLFPAQTYPKSQIAMITARVDSLYRANKSLYDKAIADGDRFYNTFEFDKAIDAYTEAINFLPMEKYPREMIVTIRRTIAENAIVDILNSPVIITSNNEKEFSFTPVNIASRKNNFIYIKIKNLSGKPFNVLMRYGKDKNPNGGVVMRNLNPDGKINERLVSVKDQDLWSRDDNNWISLYPQGGDVEVSFIQVSRAK